MGNYGFVKGAYLNFESRKTGDYHEGMNGEVFKNWLQGVLPLLDENKAILMDDAPYHSVKSEKVPSQTWQKGDIVQWLYRTNVTEKKTFTIGFLSHPTPYVIVEIVTSEKLPGCVKHTIKKKNVYEVKAVSLKT